MLSYLSASAASKTLAMASAMPLRSFSRSTQARPFSPMAASVDRPIAALLEDLRQRGLAEDTLVVWTTEFGRTPFSQGSLGRDHNCGTFVSWLWGAGIKGGISHGVSDEIGYQAADDITTGYDMHATILHLLGIDHEKLTVRTNGVDRRLTDVHGHVVREVLV